MSLSKVMCLLSVVLVGAMLPGRAQAQAPVPVQPRATLWSFLGIPQTYTSVRDNWSNRNGNRPNAERKPNLKRLADPKNLESENPAIKRAAEIKKEEDLAKQKIKAVKYLTKIGCGCYNRDGSITDALLKALDDCTEDVRYETVKAITEAANGEACVNCKNKSCCSEELSNKLYEMAYERDDSGCYLEPSERVRLAAAEALRACCPGGGGGPDYIVEEGGTGAETIDGGGGERPDMAPPGGGERPELPPAPPQPVPGIGPTPLPPPVPTPAVDPAPTSFEDQTGEAPAPAQKSSRRTANLYNGRPTIAQASGTTSGTPASAVAFASEAQPSSRLTQNVAPVATPGEVASPFMPAAAPQAYVAAPPAQQFAAQPARPRPTFENFGPAVATAVDHKNNEATVSFPGGETAPVGSILRGYHNYALTGKHAVGDFVVIQSDPGIAIVRPRGQTRLGKLMSGDELILLQ
ncbi:hypothetical protein ETAA8_03430 [Anatilimnocola aggregata]|uniref:Uncharacterized protein n=1 Tax=Anatilimnocola aggregata TaxID=2528021 RepID=A0A517Y4V6_9BACT|nr:hypothetical protein [Anatilimnocola aggregata]QDU25279.1 hypothetical protein ETAA8_03430 [Anatilimnocola aggregata]